MQKYVEAAAQGMDRVSSAGKVSGEVLAANKRVVEAFDAKMQEFAAVSYTHLQGMEAGAEKRNRQELKK